MRRADRRVRWRSCREHAAGGAAEAASQAAAAADAAAVAAQRACADTETACADWAAAGECERNEAYMRGACCLSCRQRRAG